MQPKALALPAPRCPVATAMVAVNTAADEVARLGRLPAKAARAAVGQTRRLGGAFAVEGRRAARHGRMSAEAGIAALKAILPKACSSPRIVSASPHPSEGALGDATSDERLVVAHRTGDPTALRQLIERYQNELHGFLTRLTGSRAAADDVFQETFLQVHLSAESFDAERRFKPWLYTIAANKGRDFLRRQRRRAAASLDAPIGSEKEASLVDLLEGTRDTPAEPLEHADEAGIVKAVIDDMPPHFREILLLSYYQRMSYAQISDSLSIPLGTVKSRLHAAVASFADSWKIACARRGVRADAPSVRVPSAAGRRNDGRAAESERK